MVDCSVCLDTCKIIFRCPKCDFFSCEFCWLQYWKDKPFQLECMSCRKNVDLHYITKEMSPFFINKICQYRKDIYKKQDEFKKSLKRKIIELKKQKKEIQTKISILQDELSEPTKTIGFCCKTNCSGRLYKGICFQCGERACKKCGFSHEAHLECEKNTIQPCPVCKVPVEKSDGCNHMFCTHCSSGFDWDKNQVYKKVINPHFFQFQEDQEKEKQKIRNAFETDGKKRELWLRFQELVFQSRRLAVVFKNKGKNQKEKWANDNFSHLFSNFDKNGIDLIQRVIFQMERGSFPQDEEFQMYDLLSTFNKDSFDIGDKLKQIPPRILGWKFKVD